jgi:tRNA modification GTPase
MVAKEIIAAVATAPGRSGIGIVRISGPSLTTMIGALAGRSLPPRRAVHTRFLDRDGGTIDEGIALYFPTPHSYTGEDVLELHGHGGPVVMQLLLKRCLDLGARVAQPGEFTKRAFLNDKLDLAQAEGVADLIDASTAEAARCALRSLQGAFSDRIHELGRELTNLRMWVEATLDFPEEELDFLRQPEAEGKLGEVRQKLNAVLEASQQGSLLREGIHIVLAGQPNVGKSSLLNRMAGADLAIVTEIPGTTRDAIRVTVDVGGVPAHIIDTAGLRESVDPVERIGVARTWGAIEKADLVVLLIDSTSGETEADRKILARLPQHLPRLRVMNKIDLLPRKPTVEAMDGTTVVWLSAKTGEGVPALCESLLETVGWRQQGEGVFMARERHLQALAVAREHVDAAAQHGRQLELLAEELRLAQEQLSTITGEFTADDLLGEIFSRFCIGK